MERRREVTTSIMASVLHEVSLYGYRNSPRLWILITILTVLVVIFTPATYLAVGPRDVIAESMMKASRKFTTTATRCPTIPFETLQPDLKGQDSEDKHLLSLFNGLCNGTYIEMGGLDGLTFSNTFVFNRALQWKGLLVEASPSSFEQLVQNRPNELATVHAAVCDERKKVHYYDSGNGAVKGIWEFAPASFRDRWWKGVTIEQTTPIECSPLRDILKQHVPNQHYFDFFSLDIEGAEFVALQSLDFDQVGFGIVLIEADEHNLLKNFAVHAFMESKGYRLLSAYSHFTRSIWFMNEEFATIYKDLLLQ